MTSLNVFHGHVFLKTSYTRRTKRRCANSGGSTCRAILQGSIQRCAKIASQRILYLDTAVTSDSYPSTDALDNRISLPVHCNINASKIEGAAAGFGRINRREGASCLLSGTVDAIVLAAIDLTVRN